MNIVLSVDSLLGQKSIDKITIEVDTLGITLPQNNDIVRKGDIIEIQGYVPSLNYQVQVKGQGKDTNWNSNGIEITSSVSGIVARWDTNFAEEGLNTIRLSVGEDNYEEISLYIDRSLHAGWPVHIPLEEFISMRSSFNTITTSSRNGTVATLNLPAQNSISLFWCGNFESVVVDVDNNGNDEIIVYQGGNPPKLLVYGDDGKLKRRIDVGTTKNDGIAGGNLISR